MYGRCGPPDRCISFATDEAGPTDDMPAEPPAGVADRDWQVLQELARGDDAQVGFQGIKRRLDLHPEALRRVLKRLQRDGLVAKDTIGYRLTDGGHSLVARHGIRRTAPRPMPVAFLLTPSHVTPDRIVDALARRWFDGLHWYGISEGAGERTLTWLTDTDDQPVRVRVALNGVRIEAAVGDAEPDERLQAAAPLIAAIADLLRQPPRANGHGTRDGAAGFAA